MEFTMQIDTLTNPRKRTRASDSDEPSLAELHSSHPVAKKARQSDADASPRDSAAPASPSDSSSDSGPSTPASVDVDMDMMDDQPQPLPQVQVQTQTQPRQQGTIISGWNQAQRERYLRQGYPLSWMQGTRVSFWVVCCQWLWPC